MKTEVVLLTEVGVEPGLNLLLRGPFIDLRTLRSQCDQGRAHGLHVTGFNLKDEISHINGLSFYRV